MIPPHEAVLAEELRPAGLVHCVLGVREHMEFVVDEPSKIRTTRSRTAPPHKQRTGRLLEGEARALASGRVAPSAAPTSKAGPTGSQPSERRMVSPQFGRGYLATASECSGPLVPSLSLHVTSTVR